MSITPDPTDPTAYYYAGSTTQFAYQADQRFSYCMYVPSGYNTRSDSLPVVVLQHGTGRRGPQYRDQFEDFAEANNAVILAPLFPAAIEDPDDLHNFKFIKFHDIRFDLILLGMIDEVATKLDIRTDRFLLHGFSGGGQFTHRFFYIHPDRLMGVSIGAPGRITLIDEDLPWWLGWKDMQKAIGISPKPELLPQVPVQMVVGSEDVETWEINNPGGSNWMDGAERAGRTRIERLRTLERNFRSHDIDVRFDLVPGVAHKSMLVLDPVKAFFRDVLAKERLRQGA